MPWSVYNSNGKLLQSLAIGDDSIVEGKLDVSNAPTNGQFLQAQSGEGGGLTWAAPGGGPSQATQAALEAETNEDSYASPDLMKHHPGVAKGYCTVAADGTLQSNVYNVSGSTRQALGRYEVAWDTNFANTNYAVSLTIVASGQDPGHSIDSPEVGTVDLDITNSDESAYIDKAFHIIAFGDQ